MSYVGESGESNAIAVRGDEVEALTMNTGTIGRFVATGSLTAGRYGLFRWEMPARIKGAGGHFHRTFSEAFYVLEGTPSFFDGRAWSQGELGFFLYVPEGGIHGFRNDSDALASMLILFAPGIAREGYFRELAEIGASGREMSKADWADLYERYDQVMVDDG